MSNKKHHLFLVGIICLFLVICLFQIDTIPGEWYEDISIVNNYVADIQRGNWPFYFILSAGPLYHYLIVPIIFVFGNSYLGYKLASIFVGTLGLLSISIYSKGISTKYIALLTTAIATFSFWYFAFSRLGNSQIVIPILTSSTVYFLIRFDKHPKLLNIMGGIFVASLGLFVYPQTFILPAVFLFILVVSLITKRKLVKSWKLVFVSVAGFIPAIILFGLIIVNQSANFITGYIGTKIFGASQFSFEENVSRLAIHMYKTVTMLHGQGDVVFRYNIPKSPHLDILSGLLLFAGIFYWLKKERRREGLLYIVLPLVFFILPSVSPALPPIEIPSMSRTIGIVPFVYLLVASGLWALYEFLAKTFTKTKARMVFLFIITTIMAINFYKYYILYPQRLPNGNTPFGKIIADYIDTLPKATSVYLSSCCWGEWRQPEKDAIYYQLKNKEGRDTLLAKFVSSCNDIPKTSSVIIMSPLDKEVKNMFKKCFPNSQEKNIVSSNQPVATVLHIP